MSTLKMFRAAALLIWALSAVAFSQNDTYVVQDNVTTFVLQENGTVWGIWEQYGTVPWTAFYNATAALNPEEATDRFTSVPIGALISIPTSLLQMNLVSALLVEGPVNASETSMFSAQFENLSAAVLLQGSSTQSVSTSVESLASAVETLGETLSQNVPLVVAAPARTIGFTLEQWLLLGSMLANLLLFGILVTAVVFYLREQKKLRAVIRDFPRYPVVVPRTRDEERNVLELRLHQENRELRESNNALEAEKRGLEAQVASYIRLLAENKQLQERNEILSSVVGSLEERLGLYEESPETLAVSGAHKTRRGTHGRGRSYNS